MGKNGTKIALIIYLNFICIENLAGKIVHCTECVEENNLSFFFLSENSLKRQLRAKIKLESKVELSYNKL